MRHSLPVEQNQVPVVDLPGYTAERARALERIGFVMYRPAAGSDGVSGAAQTPEDTDALVAAGVLSVVLIGMPLGVLLAVLSAVFGVSLWAWRNERRLKRSG